MGNRWTDITVLAPGCVQLGDTGIELHIDRPISGRMGFVFARLRTPAGAHHVLLEPRYPMTHGTIRYQITRIDGDHVTIAWRTPHRIGLAARIRHLSGRRRPRPSVPSPGAAAVPPPV